jgi:hypothetical protein
VRARPLVATSAVVVAGAGVVLLLVVALARAKDRPFAYFSREPAAALDAPAYVGVLSNVGVLLLWGTAVACVLAGALLRRSHPDDRRGLPLLVGGVTTGYLALDDFFQLHEELYLGELGIGERRTYAVYSLVALAYVWVFRRFLRESEWPLLALAVVPLVASAAVDTLTKTTWLEDTLKLFGVGFWAAYWVRAAVHALAPRLTR